MNRYNNISINIRYENSEEGCILLVVRTVRVNGKVVYEDKMSPEMFASCQDPIRQLEKYLLGLKESDCGKNVPGDAGKHRGFFRQIWAKLFRKKIQLAA